jgi:hypothetical protein
MAKACCIGLRYVRCGSRVDRTQRSANVVKHESDGRMEAVVVEVKG